MDNPHRMERRRTISLRNMLHNLSSKRRPPRADLAGKWLACLLVAITAAARGQTCQTGEDLENQARTSIEATALKYFALAAQGDVAALRQNSIPSVADSFSGIATAVQENQTVFARAHASIRSTFQLVAEGTAPMERAEFLCGVFGKSGQTASSAVFVLNNLPSGRYGLVVLDVAPDPDAKAGDPPYAVSLVLQQIGSDWKLGGFFVKATQTAGHDAVWFVQQARALATKGQAHNAWFYFLEARNLTTVVPFMSTRETDRLYDEAQKTLSPDAPAGAPPELAVAGRNFKIKTLFAYGIAGELNLVVKYEYPDVSDTVRTYADNQAVARALVAKWPELREAFGAIVARATEPSGKDFGTLVVMKDLK